ncbi:uncharacterized protein N0V89_009075 [Didymosphaeria variabile]|uniref:Uncharacterized protein n=1 Tax=Didymosphaeria variabile TaxID=1932322 RepID=A0A9W8XGY3_9PLEO|nr:uncharacterized protein N0V89_009075 [Didymosphaeria variabile]KAJ4350454.1 hypothetical protein N0V89_009075 [Didymosphaeria variabile]
MDGYSRGRQLEQELAAEEHEENLPQLRLQWQHLTEMLDIKLAKVPARLFADGRKPTIHDIISCRYNRYDLTFRDITLTHPDVCFPAHIPRLCTLVDLFERYDDIEAHNFKPRKLDGRGQADYLVWYWQLDQDHSFSRKHPQVMANVLLALMVQREEDVTRDMSLWADQLVKAFMYYNFRVPNTGPTEDFLQMWRNSNWDLIKFGSTKIKLIKHKLAQLRATIPKTREEAQKFLQSHIDEAIQNPDDSTYALWFFLESDWEMNETDKEAKARFDSDTDALADAFAMSGVTHDMPAYFTVADLEKPLVKALAEPTRKGLDHPWNRHPGPNPVRVEWMDQNLALQAILGDRLDVLLASLYLSIGLRATEAAVTGRPMPFTEEDWDY